MVGITLAVIATLSQVATAWMGIRLSRTGGHRVPLTIAFLALAVTGIGATAWIAARNRSHDAAALAAKINQDSAPREPRASIRNTTREVTTMGANQLVQVKIGFENSGDRPATEVRHVQMVNFIQSPYGEEEAFRLLRAELQSTAGEAVSVAPSERLAFVVEGPRLLAGDFAPRGPDDPQVIRDGRPLLVAGIVRYRADDRLEATTEYCFYAMNPKVLIACSGHND